MNQTLPFLVNFDPVALTLGPIKIHWYGIMYLIAFGLFWALGRSRAQRVGWSKDQIDDLLFWGALGVVLGGRLGYILFYDFANVIENPLRALQIWKGGMSFHGGLLGVITAMWLWGRKQNKTFFAVADVVAPLVPPGLFFGRLGNFVGGELWGRLTDAPIGMIFPKAIDGANWNSEQLIALYKSGALNQYTRHPSQLYEAALEGLVLFVVLWLYSSRPRPAMAVSGLFLLGYGIARFAVEFFRQPDAHKGFIAAEWFTMGMLLSTPMIVFGLGLMIMAYRRRTSAAKSSV